uniref:NADH-ubiquinone oxidoreductase chain 6 n=1 Tax=Aclees cribratus TaxID=2735253 RepID=A0A7L8XIP4_9CUCU|nr:NADH dehydrogenase subunit 6 [Aclees cribratus]QOH97072.1 NADH dehydrogenase subunit 6 [Aclees cribratus]
MLMYLFIMNCTFSIIFIFLMHPLSMGSILLIQSIVISLISGFLYFNFWFGYILFLIMIGGMLVMFMYMTSIASNEKFYMSKKIFLFILIMMSINTFMFIFIDNFFSNLILSDSVNLLMSNKMNNFTLMKMFNYPNYLMMILLMVYLLLTLIAVVKITGKNLGTLRQK